MSYAERSVIQISKPVKDRLAKIQREQRDKLKRQVSYTEIIEQLLDDRQALTRIGDAWQKVEQAGGAA